MRFSPLNGCAIVATLVLSPATVSAVPRQRIALEPRDSTRTPTVSIKNGTLLGRYEPQFSQDLFLNVPYAQAPSGDLVRCFSGYRHWFFSR